MRTFSQSEPTHLLSSLQSASLSQQHRRRCHRIQGPYHKYPPSVSCHVPRCSIPSQHISPMMRPNELPQNPISVNYCFRSSPVGLGSSTWLAQEADSLFGCVPSHQQISSGVVFLIQKKEKFQNFKKIGPPGRGRLGPRLHWGRPSLFFLFFFS